MAPTAPHLDVLELADTLRDHVFTLVRAGEMNAALILIRADVHAAAAALAAAGEKARVTVSVTPGGDETTETDEDEGAEDGELEGGEVTEEGGEQEGPKDDLAEKVPVLSGVA